MLIRKLFPEVVQLDNRSHRLKVTRTALRRLAFTGPCGFVLSAALFIPTLLAWRMLRYEVGVTLSPWLIYALMVIAAQFLLVLVLRKRAGRRLRTELNELGHTVCIACGYNLTGNLTGICPECGHHSIGSMPAERLPQSPPFRQDSV